MKKTAAVVIAVAIALAAAQAASAASRTAYFKASLVASQDVSWNKHLTMTKTCDGGSLQLEGNGASAIRVRTPRRQPAVARRLAGGRLTLLFAHGRSALPIVGTVTRNGVSYATGTPGTGSGCPRPEPPVAPDCGTRHYPAGSEIGVGYYTPDDWPFETLSPPLVRSIVLSGPAAPGWHGIVFQWCPGVNGDELLRGPVYEPEGAHTSPGALAPGDLFGTARRITVSGHRRDTVDTAPKTGSVIGSFPVRTTTSWTLTLTRVARRPRGL